MAGYHNIVLPETFSQGSTFAVSYDTRITALESGVEQRLARYRPEGRRRYTLLRGIASTDAIVELYEFFILRQGALNSFKFKDIQDYATNATRTTHRPNDVAVAGTDQVLTLVFGRTYQMVTRYIDSVRTIVRPITKIIPGTLLVEVNGSPTIDFTVDNETGYITIGAALGVITSVTAGCEFYNVVRFAETTDKSFNTAMLATSETQELPGIELVEDVSSSTVSQDYQYGGSYALDAVTADITLSEINGRVQTFKIDAAVQAILPPVLDIPAGGPIFSIENSVSSGFSLEVVTAVFTSVIFIAPGTSFEFFLGVAPVSGIKVWIAA
jgi:uncharacterized protein (TIGR02217 family)